jgi:hypothetical protein
MRSILKFKRKNGDYKFTNTRREWESANGIHYVHYPFMVYKDDRSDNYKLTHLSSGALVCSTKYLHSAKYIASRLLPLPQFLLPDDSLVKHMTEEQKRFCTDIISRYRDQNKEGITYLDKNCPFTI